MVVRVLCTNPDCAASVSLDPSELGKGQRCRKCGWPLDADAGPAATQPFVPPLPDSPLKPGINLPNPLAGRYKLIKVLGRGGMGAVYLAQDMQLRRQVALKVPLISGDEDPDFLKRFQREACALAQFHHPNICPVHDVGNHDGQPYLVMAFIEGTSLAAHLKERTLPFEPSKAARLVRILALAMQKAHEAGIIHRDLKPGNIMISREGRPIVMDFGVARREGPEETLHTRTGEMLGTPSYMPLEQFRGDVHRIGPGCDIYSLGVIVYRLLTGRLPYEGSPALVLEQLLTTEPPPPSSYQPGLGLMIDQICLKALARNIEDRFASMTEFAHALGSYLDQASGQPKSGGRAVAARSSLAATARVLEDRPTPTVAATERASPLKQWDHLELSSGEQAQPQAKPLRRWIKNSWYWVCAGVVAVLLLLAVNHYIVPETSNAKIARTDPPNPVRKAEGKKSRPPDALNGVPDGPAPGFAESIGIRLVSIPSGSFVMGTTNDQINLLTKYPIAKRDFIKQHEPAHRVSINQFWIASHEVTVSQFRRFADEEHFQTDAEKDGQGGKGWNEKTGAFEKDSKYTWRAPGFPQWDDHPVVLVSWNDANAFCEWLSRKDGRKFQLPTEAQWEYACRAGSTTVFPNGDDPNLLSKIGNVADATFKRKYPRHVCITSDDGVLYTAPVGNYAANEWGLHDMIGNVGEWCSDSYRAYADMSSPAIDASGSPAAGALPRVFRGGSWAEHFLLCRSGHRRWLTPETRYGNIGFRVAQAQPD